MARVSLDDAGLRRARRHLAAADPVMAGLLREIGPVPMGPSRGGSAFAYLVRAILAQQISVAAARSIGNRIRQRFGWPLRPEHVLAASDAELRALGLSRQKIGYLRDLAARTRDGLPLDRLSRLSDERVIEALTVVKGIGRWTAEMYLMFRLGRADVLPVDDLGIRSAMRRAYGMRGLPKKERMRRTASPLAPVPLDRVLLPVEEPGAAEAAARAAPRGPLARSRVTRSLHFLDPFERVRLVVFPQPNRPGEEPIVRNRLALAFLIAFLTPLSRAGCARGRERLRVRAVVAEWRGPLMTGVAPHATPPLEWSETRNVRWKVEIPGKGSATPVRLGRPHLRAHGRADRRAQGRSRIGRASAAACPTGRSAAAARCSAPGGVAGRRGPGSSCRRGPRRPAARSAARSAAGWGRQAAVRRAA